MTALAELTRHLRAGQVYRRKELARWTNAVDRHVRQLLEEGRLMKVANGVYMVPHRTRLGIVPAKPEKLVEAFLGDDRFLMLPPGAYDDLGVGVALPHNLPVVYNHKRHGRFRLDGRFYDFRLRPTFPSRLSREVLLIEMLHNLDRWPGDRDEVLAQLLERACRMDRRRLLRAARDFGSARAQRLLAFVA